MILDKRELAELVVRSYPELKRNKSLVLHVTKLVSENRISIYGFGRKLITQRYIEIDRNTHPSYEDKRVMLYRVNGCDASEIGTFEIINREDLVSGDIWSPLPDEETVRPMHIKKENLFDYLRRLSGLQNDEIEIGIKNWIIQIIGFDCVFKRYDSNVQDTKPDNRTIKVILKDSSGDLKPIVKSQLKDGDYWRTIPDLSRFMSKNDKFKMISAVKKMSIQLSS